jgi:hypothetical protein
MNNEDTIYDENVSTKSQNSKPADNGSYSDKNNAGVDNHMASKSSGKSVWGKVAAGAGAGIVLGAATTVLSSSSEPVEAQQEIQHPEWTDGEVPVATSVNDDMSFTDAFNAAREEVGSGGVFEWHGYIYSTYTDDEWNSMSEAEREEYGSHFNWTPEDSDDVTASVASDVDTDDVEVTVDGPADEPYAQEDVADVEPAGGNDPHLVDASDVVDVDDPEVEVLGVIHDDETGANIGGMLVGDQQVVLVDVDNDQAFDVMVADVDNNGTITDNEVIDISAHGITVDQLGGLHDCNPDMNADDGMGGDINDGMTYGA